ncbi:MAG: universal stress protein [Acidobacteriota bacterium]
MKILLGVDGSKFSDAAVEEVAGRPWPQHSDVDIVSVYEPPAFPTTETWVLPQHYYEEMEKASQEQARDAVNKAIERLRSANPDLRLNSEIARGYPADVILDRANRWGTNLIVLGSHGYSGLKRFLLGSVSQNVSSHAKCSVEIVRTPDTVEGE